MLSQQVYVNSIGLKSLHCKLKQLNKLWQLYWFSSFDADILYVLLLEVSTPNVSRLLIFYVNHQPQYRIKRARSKRRQHYYVFVLILRIASVVRIR